jgi:hypothetical protein
LIETARTPEHCRGHILTLAGAAVEFIFDFYRNWFLAPLDADLGAADCLCRISG